MAATVPTVTGPVGVEVLGRTLVHEHLFTLSPEVALEYPSLWDEEREVARSVAALHELHAAGIDTIVDLTVFGLGRYIPRIQRVAAASPVQVVVATGIYVRAHLSMYFHVRSKIGGPEWLAELYATELTEGIGETGVRAAVIKATTDVDGITEGVGISLTAAALAQRWTGAPIITHTHDAPDGEDQQRWLERHGADLSRVVIGHVDRAATHDLHYVARLIRNGSAVAFDRFALPDVTTEDRVRAVAALCADGYADRILLSHDTQCFTDFVPPAMWEDRPPEQGRFTFISQVVLPQLRAHGVTEEQIDQMLIHNPRRILSPAAPTAAGGPP